MELYCVDTSIFITAWYVLYPAKLFPSLWEQIAAHRDGIIIIKPVYDEIDPLPSADRNLPSGEKSKKYPLRTWLTEHGFRETPLSAGAERLSLEWEKAYETSGFSKGASKNDLRTIACAKLRDKTVVSFAKQVSFPSERSRYKVPSICREQDVDCIDFIGMLTQLHIRV